MRVEVHIRNIELGSGFRIYEGMLSCSFKCNRPAPLAEYVDKKSGKSIWHGHWLVFDALGLELWAVAWYPFTESNRQMKANWLKTQGK